MYLLDCKLTLVLRHERTIRKNFKGAGNCGEICRKFTKKTPYKYHLEIREKEAVQTTVPESFVSPPCEGTDRSRSYPMTKREILRKARKNVENSRGNKARRKQTREEEKVAAVVVRLRTAEGPRERLAGTHQMRTGCLRAEARRSEFCCRCRHPLRANHRACAPLACQSKLHLGRRNNGTFAALCWTSFPRFPARNRE